MLCELDVHDSDVTLDRPREAEHGDLATNVALRVARRLARPPRVLASHIVDRLDIPQSVVTKVEVAGPGFINFWLADGAVTDVLPRILREGASYGRSASGAATRVNIEFVSANPTGALHVGHGRSATLGDAIASLLEATGHEVVREIYINEAGVQIDRLAQSLWARIQQAVGRTAAVPDGGYHGEYVVELADRVLEQEGQAFADLPADDAFDKCKAIAVADRQREQLADLATLGVHFDEYPSDTKIHDGGNVTETLTKLSARGVGYERDGLRRESFGAGPVQTVRVIRDGEEVRFSKRSEDFVTLRDLFEQTGVDAARYFFLLPRGDAQFVFDIDLATKQSLDNPVYRVQYAHTRMCRVVRTAGIDGAGSVGEADLCGLAHADELALTKRLAEYPVVVRDAANAREPHRVIAYLEDVARMVNGWYRCHRVLDAPEDVRRARLVLARASQIVLANGLNLVGITAPDRM